MLDRENPAMQQKSDAQLVSPAAGVNVLHGGSVEQSRNISSLQ
jgi:hypothetical protein